MKRTITLPSLFLAAALLGVGSVHAEDIDIFLADPDVVGDAPNVLFVIDNGASWNASIGGDKKEEMVVESMHYVITHEDFRNKVNLGLMPFAHGNSPKGGTVLVHAQALDAARQAYISCRLYSTTPGADGICPVERGEEVLERGNNSPYGLTLNEAYRYYRGLSPMSGLQDGVYAAGNPRGYDPAAISGGNYNSPAHNTPCVSNYIIVIGTGDPDNGENNDAEARLKTLGGWLPSDPIRLTEDQYQSSWGDEFARFIRRADINPAVTGTPGVVTYVIDVFDPNANKNKPFLGARAYYQSIATQGGGTYYTAQNKQEVLDAITNIMNEIQSVNTVFASVSLPISVNVQGTNQNQVYIGMFRPDPHKVPRWVGNIKRYQYRFNVNGDPYLAGSDGNAAYNAATGFINETAVSYWTTTSTFWSFHNDYDESDRPDGDIVEKGAAAQRLRERATARNLLTCTGDCASFDDFDTDNSNVTDVLSDDVINWARGQDIQDENQNGATTDRRASIHGDVLHSRPAVVNYHRTAEVDNGEDVVVFYGSNDGVFRAIEGDNGEELWGFIAEEHYPLLQTMYANADVADGDPWRPYAVDGNTTVISLDVNKDGRLKVSDGDKVYLYLTMRRGGRMIYAFDVSDPANPEPMWRKDHTSAGFSELGQTWSPPSAAYVRYLGVNTPVLIFGLGYDSVEDNVIPTGKTMGRGIMMVNALTGAPIWQAGPNPSGASYNKTVSGMDYAIPSEVRLVNRSGNSSNYAETIYVGDTGGNVWRADIRDANPDNWTVSKLAAVGGCAGVDCRKFLYPPSVVFGTDYDAVLMGSGDREKPFDRTVTNRFYMFKDTWGAGTTIAESDMLDVTNTPTTVDKAVLDTKRGWYITLDTGEKVVGQAITLSSTTIFNTNLPAASNRDEDGNIISCGSNLGTAREYYVNYLLGTALPTMGTSRYTTLPGGGFPPPPVPMTLVDPETGKLWTGTGGLKPVRPGGGTTGQRKRTFWYNLRD